jgi:integrase
VSVEKIDAYRARLVEDGKLSARTINKRLVVLHGILRRAMRVYELRTNPAALVDRQPLRRSGEFAVLSPAEVEALARAADNEQDAALFCVAAFTGLRLGAALAGRRFREAARPRPPELHARGGGRSEVGAGAECAADRPGREGARRAQPARAA